MKDAYEEFYRRADASPAFSAYCAEVYGIDLAQDGFADRAQLDSLAALVGLGPADRCLDIGSGNGRIADYLRQASGAAIDGLDCAAEAITQARRLWSGDAGLSFFQGDINDLDLAAGRYTVVVLIDSLYFSQDYAAALDHIHQRLAPGGRIGLGYSEFVFDPARQTGLIGLADTVPARLFARRGWNWQGRDCNEAHYALMRRKRQACERRRAEFEREGNVWLYEKLHRESVGPETALEDFRRFTNRYLYRVTKD